MKTASVLVRGSGHQPQWCGAFAAGLKRHGWSVTMQQNPVPADLMVVWGVRRRAEISAQRKRGGEVCILERGYLGDRFNWTSVSFGGKLNGRAEFRGARADARRFKRHFGKLMRPWEKREGYALLIGQVPGDMSLDAMGGNIDRWYRETASVLKGQDLNVRFRPHPSALRRGFTGSPTPDAPLIGGTLQQALAGASRVITFNSNTGVESVLAGIPTVACDIGSMAWPMTSHEVGDSLVAPDRDAWAAELAWKQFSVEEITSGFCWNVVGRERVEQSA